MKEDKGKDKRFCYSATCTWFGSIYETKQLETGIPCCPHCRGVLFELPQEKEWWEAIDVYETNNEVGYRAMWEWQREQKRCFPLMKDLRAAYRNAKT